MPTVRMAQYGTKHGHALGKLLALIHNPEVELAGVYEPDPRRREELLAQNGFFKSLRWFDDPQEFLADPSIVAVASEGLNSESLAQTEQIIDAGKHVWYDKPAGEDWSHWQRVAAKAQERRLHIQMGYMFRYHNGFRRIARWVHTGLLGEVYAIRAHMSTWINVAQRRVIGQHRGGIFYDLGGHMLDQIVWLLGRPARVTSFLRNDGGEPTGFADNTLCVLEYAHGLAYVDIAAMEARPMARRFEVYGSKGSAILLEPFEPAHLIRLCLEEADGGYNQGEQLIPVSGQARQELYDLELEAFVRTITGRQPPDRSLAHESLVQETLLRAVGHHLESTSSWNPMSQN